MLRVALILCAIAGQVLSAPKPCLQFCADNQIQQTQVHMQQSSQQIADHLRQIVQSTIGSHDYSKPGTWMENKQYKIDGGAGQAVEQYGQVVNGGSQTKFYKDNYSSSGTVNTNVDNSGFDQLHNMMKTSNNIFGTFNGQSNFDMQKIIQDAMHHQQSQQQTNTAFQAPQQIHPYPSQPETTVERTGSHKEYHEIRKTNYPGNVQPVYNQPGQGNGQISRGSVDTSTVQSGGSFSVNNQQSIYAPEIPQKIYQYPSGPVTTVQRTGSQEVYQEKIGGHHQQNVQPVYNQPGQGNGQTSHGSVDTTIDQRAGSISVNNQQSIHAPEIPQKINQYPSGPVTTVQRTGSREVYQEKSGGHYQQDVQSAHNQPGQGNNQKVYGVVDRNVEQTAGSHSENNQQAIYAPEKPQKIYQHPSGPETTVERTGSRAEFQEIRKTHYPGSVQPDYNQPGQGNNQIVSHQNQQNQQTQQAYQGTRETHLPVNVQPVENQPSQATGRGDIPSNTGFVEDTEGEKQQQIQNQNTNHHEVSNNEHDATINIVQQGRPAAYYGQESHHEYKSVRTATIVRGQMNSQIIGQIAGNYGSHGAISSNIYRNDQVSRNAGINIADCDKTGAVRVIPVLQPVSSQYYRMYKREAKPEHRHRHQHHEQSHETEDLTQQTEDLTQHAHTQQVQDLTQEQSSGLENYTQKTSENLEFDHEHQHSGKHEFDQDTQHIEKKVR